MTKRNLDALRLTCRFDAEQADYVRALADRMELPAAEVVRLAVGVLVERVPPSLFDELKELPPETRAELSLLTQEVNHIGVNVNQAVRAINTHAVEEIYVLEAERDGAGPEEIAQLRAELGNSGTTLKSEMRDVLLELQELRKRVSEACRS